MTEQKSLRDIIDCIEACDVLIKYYEEEFKKGINEEIRTTSEGYAGWGFTTIPGEKIEFYKRLKEYLAKSIERDETFERYAGLIRR